MRGLALLFFVLLAANPAFAQWSEIKGAAAGQVECLAVSGNKIFAGVWACGVYMSTDNGATWDLNTGLGDGVYSALAVIEDSSRVLLGTNFAIELSTDNGVSWGGVSNGDAEAFAVCSAASGGTIAYAGSAVGVICSTTDGDRWGDVSTGLPEHSIVNALAIKPRCADTLVFAGTNNGVYASPIGETSWTSKGLTGGAISCFAVQDQYLFAGTLAGEVLRSSNNGSNWTSAGTGITARQIWSLQGTGTTLFAGTNCGVYRSTNHGTSWSAVNVGLADTQVSCLAVHGSTVYAGTMSGRIYMADAGTLPVELTGFGATLSDGLVVLRWQTATEANNYGFDIERRTQSVNDRATPGPWKRIGFVPGHGSSNSPHEYIFADPFTIPGGRGYRLRQIDRDGAFSYSDIVQTVVSPPAEYHLSQNYPNPFNPTTTLSYDIPGRSHVVLSVFNTLGERVAELVNGEKEAGTYVVTFDARGLASGVYLYRMEAGGFVQTRKLMVIK
ncbi:MAG TPA: T9SS type A sorting domain-containing protein [Bacteroidota bacterium]|nr:T9SS type A sorting domain-containing protein [Bacteroidota bacterium]